MSNATTHLDDQAISDALARHLRYSRNQEPALFAASLLSDAQEQLARQMDDMALQTMYAAISILSRSDLGRSVRDHVDTVRRQLRSLMYAGPVRDGFREDCMDALNEVKSEIFCTAYGDVARS